jgi:hypothetical protein
VEPPRETGRIALELLGTFETVAQIAIALTGFTGVVVALGRRELAAWAPTERFLLRALLYWSLGTMFLAFVPAALSGVAAGTAWRLAHAVFAVFHSAVFAWFFQQSRRYSLPFTAASLGTVLVGLGVLLGELAVVVGLVTRAAPYLYLLALLWFVFLAAVAFAALVFPAIAPDESAA